MIVTSDAVAQRTQSLVDALHHDGVGQRVPQVLQLLVAARVWDQ